MGNPLKGEVSFADGADTYVLAYSIQTFCVLEDALDLSLGEISERLQDQPRLAFLRTVFWAGLQSRHPNISVLDAGELMGRINIRRGAELITEAIGAAFPPKAEAASSEAGPRKTPARRGTGRSS